ncbi:hypothetical protein BH24ACT5_BH24ACT5_00840 [soil metagenome]
MEVIRSTKEWERQLGKDLRRERIAGGSTMQEVANRANLSVGALRNLEHGRGATVGTLIRVLRALDRTDWLESLASDVDVSPMEMLRQRQRDRARQRVRRSARTSS